MIDCCLCPDHFSEPEPSRLRHITKIGDHQLRALPGVDDSRAFACEGFVNDELLRSATFDPWRCNDYRFPWKVRQRPCMQGGMPLGYSRRVRTTKRTVAMESVECLIPTDQGSRFLRPPAGLPTGLRESAAGLLAGLLRGFCTLNGLPLDKPVPIPAASARFAGGLLLFSPICGLGFLPSTCMAPGAACGTFSSWASWVS